MQKSCDDLLLTEHISGSVLFYTEDSATSPGIIDTASQQSDSVILNGLPYTCNVCGDSFAEKSTLLHHRLTHSEEIIEACDTSNKVFSKKSAKLKPLQRAAGVDKQVCMICNRTFSNWWLLQRHRDVHIGTKNYACNMCSKHFVSPRYLKEHFRRTHSGEKPYKCDICRKSFSTKDFLDHHKLLHREFECQDCNCSFSSEYALKVHRTTHTTKKLPTCDICSKVFAHQAWLKRHMLTHTGKRSFICGMCGKAFAQKGNLKVHLQSHIKEKRCHLCGETFPNKKLLERHMYFHASEVIFSP